MSTKKNDGEAFSRLRAADPAADLSPDLTTLRAAVGTRATVVDELATRRRRSSRALQVAAASAGALAIGASGFALGGGFAPSGGTGSESASANGDGAAQPPITLEMPASDFGSEQFPNPAMAPEGEMGMGGAVTGGDRATSAQGGEDAAYLPGFFGRTVFSQSGLSTSGGSSSAYGYDPTGALDEDKVRALADALGVKGKIVDNEGYLMIGSYESGEANLSVYADGLASFNFYDPAKDPWQCEYEGDGECTERKLGDAPQGDDARDAANDLLVRLGLDPASFELEVTDASMYESKDYSSVAAYRVVDGQRTGDQWGVSFTGGGVQSVWGSLAAIVDLGEYDVVSPAEAVERLGDPRFGPSNMAHPLGWNGPAVMRDSAAPGSSPTAPTPGTSFDWSVENVTIVSERLGLAQHHLADGSVALVPTYELSSEDGRSWSVIAVTEAHLDFS